MTLRRFLIFVLFFEVALPAFGQRFLSDYDSTLFLKDTMPQVVRRLENLHFSGYIQPQFQIASSKGAPSYNGGAFQPNTNNRFMLRRARIKVDYILPNKEENFPQALFTFQIDATERGVVVRDMFAKVFEPKGKKFSLTAGIFARPFGYEINLSSAFRETPERGRASQILMPTERDLGAMISYETKKRSGQPQFKWDAGFFNGQGLSGPADFDSYKDLITRLAMKPWTIKKHYTLSAGLSYLNGGWMQASRYRYQMALQGGNRVFAVDSSLSNVGSRLPRIYYGADAQFAIRHRWGKTEWRAEYWWGRQPGTEETTTNPGTLPLEPNYLRRFDAAFFYFLQNIVNEKWELMVKWDWYDPNTDVKGADIGKAGTNLSTTDVKYSTLGAGLTHYVNDKLKVLAYYDWVQNEATRLNGFTADQSDNIFTLRMQFRF
jgi:phosphate-selective porin